MKWNKNDILALMVGHGTQLNGVWDSGTTYKGYTEAELMLPIVKEAVKRLRKSGVKVLTDADKNNNINMTKSVAWANQKKCRLYFVCHCDWAPAKSGIMFYYASSGGKKFGDYVSKYCSKKMGLKFKGGTKDPKKYEVGQTNMPAVLYESGAIKANLKTLKQAKKYGRAIAQAICKYIGVTYYVSNRTKLLRKTAAIISYMNLNHFKYTRSYKDCADTWKGAKKVKRSNCSCAMSYAAQETGLLNLHQIFWFNVKKIACVGKGTKTTIKKNFQILNPDKKPKDAGLKKGDLTCSGNAHTQEFAGWKSYPTFYSWGPGDVGKKQPRHKKSYDTKKVTIIMRAKG